ncbi:epidermal growth factor receptor kinase substrate 8-like protein 3 [Carassius gibelio]|uniref:epidermal growth factor receptor kinase substrate 8-like protein 3 n=1 Tax=Carassius gibelio TaxID=101364 RepID=UPI0022783984|nr:epidermal growth factor receptor kinase substrate 8-like protein 3 [Carassius gibelio]XP_052460227.1 epidermal growth factor receptor kinase substrate 8-like protein 3 [Carassius gibelio]
MRAVLDSCVFDSLLMISVQDPGQRAPQAFLFQCEEIGAQEVANDLEKAIQQGGVTIPLLIEPQMDIKSHLERMIGWGYPGSMNRPAACSQTLLPQNSHFLCTATMKTMMVSQYPPNIPPTVLNPLLTEKALHLLGKFIKPNEDVLWGSLDDAWSIPRSKWPNGDQSPPYYPEFYDGWQPLQPGPSQSPPASRQLSWSNSERFPLGNVMQRSSEQENGAWKTRSMRSAELPLYMRVLYYFMACWVTWCRTIQNLGVFNGAMLLGMKRDDMRAICPEEGG